MAHFEGGYYEPRASQVNEFAGDATYGSRTYDDSSLRAFTLLQFTKATAQDAMADTLLIDGHETNNVVVIGEIMSMTMHSSYVQYVLDDGTGVINVKKFKDRKDDATLEETSEEGLEEHTWVMVHGHHRPFANESFINAFSIRPITDFNEMTCHFARCIQQHLYFARGPPPSHGAQTPPRPSFGHDSVRRSSLPTRGGSVSDDVAEAIRQLFLGGNELHIDEICRQLEDDFGKRKIREAVREMADKGQLYLGSSDESYAWSG